MKLIRHIILLPLLIMGFNTSCENEKITREEKGEVKTVESHNSKERDNTFELSAKLQNDTTFFLQKEYPNNQILKFYSTNKTGTSFNRFKEYLNDDFRLRDNTILLKQSKKAIISIDQSILNQLKGKYVAGTILENDIFISHWDYFCSNRTFIISDQTIFDVYGCEGFYQKPIINVNQIRENVFVLEALKYPSNLNSETNTELSMTTYNFYTSRLKTEGIVIVESNLFNEKEYYYLIHEDFVNEYKELKCHTNNGPCLSSLIDFINNKNEQEIKKTIDNK